MKIKGSNGRGGVTNVGCEENSLGCFDASLSAYDLLRGRRCCRGGGRAASLDVTGLTNLEGSASSSLDDLGERFLAGGTSKLMGRSRCEGGEDSGAWRSRISPDFGFLLVQVVRFHGLKNFAKLWKSTLQVFGVQLILHELELGVGKSIDEDHSKDVVKAHVAGGGRVKDGGEGAAMVEEGVSEGSEGSCLFDGEELMEGTLRNGEAACTCVALFSDTSRRSHCH